MEKPLPEVLTSPVERTHTGALCEELQPVGRNHIGEGFEGLSHLDVNPCWSRGREDKGTTEIKCYELTTILIPHPGVAQEEEVEELRAKLSLGKRER